MNNTAGADVTREGALAFHFKQKITSGGSSSSTPQGGGVGKSDFIDLMTPIKNSLR